VYATEKTVRDYGDRLSAGDKEKIQAAVDRLKKAKDSDSPDEIKRAIDDANRTLHDFSKTLYEAAAKNASQAETPQGGNGGTPSSGSQDKVIDADFKTK
jgi:molecular chaperone DnaK